MSTPSTATATLPPHHQFYPHHQAYQPNLQNAQLANGSARLANSMYSGYSSGTSNTDIRRTATAHTRQPQPIQTQALAPDMGVNAPGSASRRTNPNWAEFYKNGLPKEVIVIDDDEEEEPAPQQQPPPPPPPAAAASARQPVLTRTATTGSLRHADKKRKTAASTAYDPVYNQHTSYSTTQTPGYYDSPNHSTSTDRTTSALNTTAATSLGSQASNGHHISPLDTTAVGQKRKRTRAVAQDEAKQSKRRELDHDDNPFSLYQPPPNPVIKAKDVYVNVVADVRRMPVITIPSTDSSQKSYTKDQKVDDEDGHYIVVPDADLTERCACRPHLYLCYR
jgi:dual-specificity kinase